MEKEEPCLEIQPSQEMMEVLEGPYMGELHQVMEVREVQQRLFMEGLSMGKATVMGGKLFLL